ncbi:MAG: adenosine kinase [Pseudomonadota bacterium]
MTGKTQLIGISNAIVDILANVDYDFLNDIGAPPGSMTLIDADQARSLYSKMGPAMEMSGGSVANTVAGFANLGGVAAYIGRVATDQFGEVFVHDMRSLGIDVRTEPAADGAPTARSHVLITEDGQRTMQTYLGACTELSVSDVTANTVGDPEVILLEGYVWDIPEGPALADAAFALGKEKGAKLAMSLSDSFCVERHRDAYRAAIRDSVDIVFADEDEMTALFDVDDFDSVLPRLDRMNNLFVMTRSAKGSVIVHGEQTIQQDAIPVAKVLDTTGAGDAYTAAFLYGYTQGRSLEDCAKLGTFCGAQVIQQLGARLEKDVLADYPFEL